MLILCYCSTVLKTKLNIWSAPYKGKRWGRGAWMQGGGIQWGKKRDICKTFNYKVKKQTKKRKTEMFLFHQYQLFSDSLFVCVCQREKTQIHRNSFFFYMLNHTSVKILIILTWLMGEERGKSVILCSPNASPSPGTEMKQRIF